MPVKVPFEAIEKRFGLTGWYMDKHDIIDPNFQREMKKMVGDYSV